MQRVKREGFDIDIEVVITIFNTINPEIIFEGGEKFVFKKYEGVKTIMFDIEKQHFKKRITLSNRLMIDECETLICYVGRKKYASGAKSAMNYAKRKGLKIVNLYKLEDNPFQNMNEEEKNNYLYKK